MDNIITVKYDNRPIYDINITDTYSHISTIIPDFMISGRKVCIISDSNVSKFYLNEIISYLSDKSDAKRVDSFVFDAGESSKNTRIILDIIKQLITDGYDRNDLLIALGGGVTGDMTGFAGAIYLRGIKFIQLPTSLLAMVDSSIGGKTGVDFEGYKNMVGAFHMPSYVFANVNTLNTLPEREYISGFAEIIKHSVISGREYFDLLEGSHDKAMMRDIDTLKTIITESCLIKKRIVEEDPNEKGIRAYLNLGHTIGHAIEKYYDFALLHGECVSLGLVAAAYISYKRNLISKETCNDIRNLLEKYKLPVSIGDIACYTDRSFDKEAILLYTKNDKKADGGIVRYVLINEIGDVFTDKTVSEKESLEALDYIM